MMIPKHCFVLHKRLCALLLGLTFFVTALPSFLFAQDPSEKGLPFVTNFHPNDFHSYPQNWSILEDSSGLMYFGNQGYILEYDGVKWKKIPVAANGTVAIRSLAKNKKGLIYYASISDLGYLSVDSLGQTKSNSLLKYIPPALRDFNDVWAVHITDDGVYFQARERMFRFKENKS